MSIAALVGEVIDDPRISARKEPADAVEEMGIGADPDARSALGDE